MDVVSLLLLLGELLVVAVEVLVPLVGDRVVRVTVVCATNRGLLEQVNGSEERASCTRQSRAAGGKCACVCVCMCVDNDTMLHCWEQGHITQGTNWKGNISTAFPSEAPGH